MMKPLVVPENDWIDVRAALGFAPGSPISIQNQSTYSVRLMESDLKPTLSDGWILHSQDDTDQWGSSILWAKSSVGGLVLMVQEIER